MKRFLMVLLAMAGALVIVPAAGAVTINVNTTTDAYGGSATNCSLREAITAAQTNSAYDGCTAGSGVDVIKLPGGEYKITRAGDAENANVTGDFDVTGTDSLSIEASDSTGKVVVNGNGLDRVFDQQGANALSINAVHVKNGLITQIEDGGGIRNAVGTLTVDSATVSNSKSAYSAGGIAAYNSLTMINSTVSGNSADGNAGGIYAPGLSLVTVRSSTITGNTADADADGNGEGGGFNDSGSTATNFFNVINAANTDLSPVGKTPDCYSGPSFFPRYVVTTQALGAGSCLVGFNPPGQNQVVADALIGPLKDNGGQTPTHALLEGSPAIGAGADGSVALDACPAFDQTGRTRPAGACDIGAVQYVEPTAPGTMALKFGRTTPKVAKVKRGKRAKVVTLRVVSTGSAALLNTRVCLKPTRAVKRALKVRGKLCRRVGTLVGTRAVKVRISAKKRAKKKLYRIKAVATATGVRRKATFIKVRVR